MNPSLNQSLPSLLRDRCQRCGNQTAIHAGEASLSFKQLDALSDLAAGWLQVQGIERGDRVALYYINSPDFVVAYFGILKSGAVVVPVNLLQNPREISYVINDAGVRGLIYSVCLEDKVAQFEMDDALLFSRSLQSAEDWVGLCENGDFSFRDVRVKAADDLAVILYTSGTTGKPKGAMLTHQNLAFDTWSASQAVQLDPEKDVLLVVLPMFHSFAASVGMIMPLLWGGSLAPVPKFDAGLVVDAIAATGATVFLGVPSMYNVLLHLPETAVEKLKTLRLCVSGGAAMPAVLMEKFEARFGIPICEGDGPTECSPVTCLNPIEGPRKPSSVGLPIPLVDMDICDQQGKSLADDEVGEICVRGDNVMKGYWHLPEATQESFFGDWFRTGDLGLRDKDGYFFIVDRIKDMIIVNGMNVYPRMVEEVFYQHPAVSEVAVVGEVHKSHGEIPVAYVVLNEGETVKGVEIRTWCKDFLGPHQVPRKVVLKASLPKNAAGKIVKRELRKQGELERGIDSRAL